MAGMPEFATSVEIEAPPEVVFRHLVTPEGMTAWMGEHAELEARPGGAFAVDVGGYLFRGEFLEVDPPRRVVVSWGLAGNADLPAGSSRVEFELERRTGGTLLRLRHTGLPEPMAATHRRGWTHYLSRLVRAATGADPGADHLPATFREEAESR
jgi:uncharacterized protein YndB with AHSA1/START domain